MNNLETVGKISIVPLINPDREDLGLQKHGYVVFPGTAQVEGVMCITQNGKTRYVTGLDEYAPEIKMIADKTLKEARIKDIRETVARLELERNYNSLNTNDKDFWEKVAMFRPDNKEVWGKLEVKLDNDRQYIDPKNNPDHLILLKVIESNGFSLIAPSLQDAIATSKSWYLEKQIDVVTANVSVTKLKNKALGLLDTLLEEEPLKLLFITKDLDGNGIQYTNKTPHDILYQTMDAYIQGLSYDKDKKRCAKSFIDAVEMSVEDLKIKSMIKDLTFHKHINLAVGGVLVESSTKIQLGRNVNEVLVFLKNPVNEDVLMRMIELTDKLWN